MKTLEIELIQEGRISGLNGVLLGVATERGLRGTCLLGEMPHILIQFPFPKASLAVLRVFSSLASIELDTHELVEQSRIMDHNLGKLLSQVEKAMEQQQETAEEKEELAEEPIVEEEPGLAPEVERNIERLFELAKADRAKAYELKQELDRLNIFKEYEGRFLDLFRKPESQ